MCLLRLFNRVCLRFLFWAFWVWEKIGFIILLCRLMVLSHVWSHCYLFLLCFTISLGLASSVTTLYGLVCTKDVHYCHFVCVCLWRMSSGSLRTSAPLASMLCLLCPCPAQCLMGAHYLLPGSLTFHLLMDNFLLANSVAALFFLHAILLAYMRTPRKKTPL